MTFERYITTQGSYSGSLWEVGSLSKTARATLTIGAKVKEGTDDQVISNSASVHAVDQTDTITGNNARNVTIIVKSVISSFIYLPIIYKDYEPLICNPYFDDFNNFNNRDNLWEIKDYNEAQLDYTARLGDFINKEKYFIYVKRPGLRIVQAPIAATNQYTVEVEAYWDNNIIGYEYGLTFGQLGGPSSPTYRFVLNSVTQSYRLKFGNDDIGWRCINQPEPCWDKPAPPSIINSGAVPNNLKLHCKSGIIQLYINHQPVWKGKATCYGQVGLVAQAYNGTATARAKVYFDKFHIFCPFTMNLSSSRANITFPSTSTGLNVDK